MKRQSPTLVLLMEDGKLTAVSMENPSAKAHFDLALDPLTDDPRLVAEELRELLYPRYHRHRHVVVGLPLHRLYITTVDLPDIPENDVNDFLRIQAERDFMLGPKETALGESLFHIGDARGAILIGMSMPQFANLQKAMRLAGFKKMIITAVTAICEWEDNCCSLLLTGRGVLDLVIKADGEIAQMRRLGQLLENESEDENMMAAVSTELRLSLGQLPEVVRQSIKKINFHAESDSVMPENVAKEIQKAVGLQVAARPLPALIPHNVSINLLAPPKPSRHLMARLPTRNVVLAGIALVFLFLILMAGDLLRSRQVGNLRREWAALEPRVDKVQEIIDTYRTQRLWLSGEPLAASILRDLTLAFPERGSVWCSRLEVIGGRRVNITGFANRHEDWLELLNQLRTNPAFRDISVTQVRTGSGENNPLTFGMSCIWEPMRLGKPQDKQKEDINHAGQLAGKN